jgi:hypothetical protein
LLSDFSTAVEISAVSGLADWVVSVLSILGKADEVYALPIRCGCP